MFIFIEQEHEVLSADYNNCEHNATVESSMNFDGKIALRCRVSFKYNNDDGCVYLSDKYLVVPIRLSMGSVKKVLAKVSINH